jgi:hypothetical protein
MVRRDIEAAKKVSVSDIEKRIKILHSQPTGDHNMMTNAELLIDDEAKRAPPSPTPDLGNIELSFLIFFRTKQKTTKTEW